MAIAEATLALLKEHGYSDLTMAEIAERARVSSATLYRRWSSKEDLVAGALATVIPERPPVDTGSLEGDMRETLVRMAGVLTGDGGRLLQSVSGETVHHPQLADAVRLRLDAPFRENLLAMLARGVSRGELPPIEDPDLTLSVILGPLHYRLTQSDAPIGDDTIDRLLGMMLRALDARSRLTRRGKTTSSKRP